MATFKTGDEIRALYPPDGSNIEDYNFVDLALDQWDALNTNKLDKVFTSITDLGVVVGDGVTNDTVPFIAAESSTTITDIYIPRGIYKTTLTTLTKRYWGQGIILLNNGVGFTGTPSSVALTKTTGLSGVNSMNGIGLRSIIFIGDSITYGYGVSNSQSYPYLVNQMANRKSGFGQGSYLSGGNLDRLTQTGTITTGTSGPLNSSLIMTPGSTLSFSGDWIDYIGIYFERTAGAGAILIKNGATVINTISCAGTPQSNTFSGVGPIIKGSRNATYTLLCQTANVEINGIFASHDTTAVPVFFQLQAKSGYATSDFVSASTIAAIKAQTIYPTFPLYIIALGTNDIFNPSKAVSAAQYKTNLELIITNLNPATCSIKLTVPLRALQTTYSPVIEPFDNYRMVVYELARKYNLDVSDLSELDIASIGAYQLDGLHPNNYGYSILADYWFKDLELSSITPIDVYGDITLLAGASNAGTIYAPAIVTLRNNGTIIMSGTISVSGIAKNTIIGILPTWARPTYRKIIDAATIAGAGTAQFLLDPNGGLTFYDYTTASSPSYASFDGKVYTITD